jgi:hypothetical protein
MNSKNVFLNKYFIDSLQEKDYEALFLLLRINSSLRLSQKLLLNSIKNKQYKNFEIIEINSNLLSTYAEARKSYANNISDPIFALLGIPFDDFTSSIRAMFLDENSKTTTDNRLLAFLRNSTTFHFHSEYIRDNKIQNGERISYVGFIDPEKSDSIVLTNSIPHILEELQKIKGKTYKEESIISVFRDINERLVFPFINYIENLVHQVIDDKLIIV